MTAMSDRLTQFMSMRDADPAHARIYWSGGPVEAGERTWFTSFFAGVTAFDTDDGVVLVDSGPEMMASTLAGAIRGRTDHPIHTAIYTHGHVDHAYGLPAFLAPGQEPPRVIAHATLGDRIHRYVRTSGHNNAINTRQFGASVPHGEYDLFGEPAIMPTDYYDGDATEIEVGGVRFELHHSRGETDDHTWVWCPERGVLCTGDLFIWAVPNAGNPQKVQRYPIEWAAALRQMAALHPRTLCPGHGGPVVDDPDRIQHMLTSTADLLEHIIEQTLAALNDGSPPHVDIVHAVDLPESDLPWLQPLYDDPEFLVRSLIRQFGGWWSGRPSELKPAPRAAVASEIAALTGGVATLAARAVELADAGDLRLAAHLADLAIEADPSDAEAQKATIHVYELRAAEESSLMASNIFASAAGYAREGRAFA